MRFLKTGILAFLLLIPAIGFGQNYEKIIFNKKDSTSGYYLAVPPSNANSKGIKGAVVLFCSFRKPESLMPETRIQNVAFTNNILTVVASIGKKLYLDTPTTKRMNAILKDIAKRFSVDTSKFVLGAFDYAGIVLLRYAELTYQDSTQFPVQPKAVFAVASPVDLFDMWHWSERQIKTNYYQGSVNDAKYVLKTLKEIGSIYDNPKRYKELTPFYKDAETPGNEKYLKNVAVRLYYDTDIEWQLKNRRNSYYDTNIPDGSELIKRLLLLGNPNAEFVASQRPAIQNNGTRNPFSMSIVDPVEFIQWVEQKLGIFNPATWYPPYKWPWAKGWGPERDPIPLEWTPQIALKGVEDILFAPGWGDPKSENYWSYIYLWWVKSDSKLDEGALKEYLKEYYQGLVNKNIKKRNIPKDKVIPTKVTIKEVKAGSGEMATYEGAVNMLDYMAQKPIVLNFQIDVKKCPTLKHTAIFFVISPQPFEHKIWRQLHKVRKSFACKK